MHFFRPFFAFAIGLGLEHELFGVKSSKIDHLRAQIHFFFLFSPENHIKYALFYHKTIFQSVE